MKSLVEHMAEQEDLEERLLRTGAIARMEREPEKRVMPLFEHSSRANKRYKRVVLMLM